MQTFIRRVAVQRTPSTLTVVRKCKQVIDLMQHQYTWNTSHSACQVLITRELETLRTEVGVNKILTQGCNRKEDFTQADYIILMSHFPYKRYRVVAAGLS